MTLENAMNNLDKIKMMAGISIDLESSLKWNQLMEARSIPKHKEKLAERNKDAIAAEIEAVQHIVDSIKIAVKKLEKIKPSNFDGTIPHFIAELEKLLKSMNVEEHLDKLKLEIVDKIENEEKSCAQENEEVCVDDESEEKSRSPSSSGGEGITSEPEELGEGTENFVDANQVSWDNDDKPVNVAPNKEDTLFDEPKEEKVVDPDKVTVPPAIKASLQSAIDKANEELKDAQVNDRLAVSFLLSVVDALQVIMDNLKSGTVRDIKLAQINMSKLMSPILHRIPDDVVGFIVNGGVKRSLKDIFAQVKEK